MFDNKRYISRGATELAFPVQMAMWAAVEAIPCEKDYLQIFNLEPLYRNNKSFQKITHEQERPAYKQTIVVRCETPVKEKCYIIDDGDHSTLLLAREY